MNEHKLTDEEIISALSHCQSVSGYAACLGCPLFDQCQVDSECLSRLALDLIERQKAEIERLRNAPHKSSEDA